MAVIEAAAHLDFRASPRANYFWSGRGFH